MMCRVCRNLSIETQWCDLCAQKRAAFERKMGRHETSNSREVAHSDVAIRQIISAFESK